ncbi:NADH-dependent flavin reductase [Pararobbsia alpina]|uniref:flavin reductase family protein n=1 Tax=Pararobbsia alpina TaxID=621374 RepID=UPI0039A54E56
MSSVCPTHDAECDAMTWDPKVLRNAMGLFATGVTVITYAFEDQPTGMTANAFMSVSLDPALVLVSVRAVSRFNNAVHKGTRYGINVLAEDQRALSMHFGGRPNADLDIPFVEARGAPLLDNSLVQLVARAVDIHRAGDHLLYLGEIEYIRYGPSRQPLIFYSGQYQQVHAHRPMITANGCVEGW